MSETTGYSPLRNLLSGLLRAPLRFPAPLASALLWAGITIAREHRFDFTDRETIRQIQVFLILGLFLSLSVKLFAESRDWKLIRWLPLTAGALGLLALIVFLGPQMSDSYLSPAVLFMGPGLILLTTAAPFLRRRAEDGLIWDYNFKSWTSAAFGLLVALMLALGITVVLGALKALFGLDISRSFFWDVWVVCLSVIWPWQTLAGMPGSLGEAREEYCPRWFSYMISWLLAPLALIYLALIYAFAAKITIQWTLPEGQVAWLVGGFAGFGLAVWHTAHPLRETGNRLVRLYTRFFHAALFVPIALLAVGVGARVAEYGITEKRYGLMVLTLWLAGIAVHGVVTRMPRLNIAPVSFAVLLMLASFGPWGASTVSLRSQFAQLDALLVEAGLLHDGKLSKAAGSVDRELEKRISSVVDYLNRPNRRQALFDLLGESGIKLEASASSEDIVAAFGMIYVNRWGRPNYQSWWRPSPDSINVGDFDAVVRINLGPANEQSQSAKIGGLETRVHAVKTGNILNISTAARGPVTIDLAQIVETLKHDKTPMYGNSRSGLLMRMEVKNNGLWVRIHLSSIEAQGIPGKFSVSSLSFVALIRGDGDRQ